MGADERVSKIMFSLGKRHYARGSNVDHMSLQGDNLGNNLWKIICNGEMEYRTTKEDLTTLINVIVYWLQKEKNIDSKKKMNQFKTKMKTQNLNIKT